VLRGIGFKVPAVTILLMLLLKLVFLSELMTLLLTNCNTLAQKKFLYFRESFNYPNPSRSKRQIFGKGSDGIPIFKLHKALGIQLRMFYILETFRQAINKKEEKGREYDNGLNCCLLLW
jgi:hypothetical protein